MNIKCAVKENITKYIKIFELIKLYKYSDNLLIIYVFLLSIYLSIESCVCVYVCGTWIIIINYFYRMFLIIVADYVSIST